MPTNLQALSTAIHLVADAALDTVAAIQPGESAFQRIWDYKNLIADLEDLVPEMGDIPSEISQLTPADVVTLTTELVDDLEITDEKANKIIAASLTLLSDLATRVLPDVEALVSAVKS